MYYFEDSLIKNKFYLTFKKFILLESNTNKDKMLDIYNKTLTCINDLIYCIKNVSENKSIENNINDFFKKSATLLDLTFKIYGLSYDVNIKKDKYSKLQNQLKEKYTSESDKYLLSFDWIKSIKDMRSAIEHDYEDIQILETNNNIYFQYFNEIGYPIVTDFLEENNFANFLIFACFKFEYMISFINLLFKSIINDTSSYSYSYLACESIITSDDLELSSDVINLFNYNLKEAYARLNSLHHNKNKLAEIIFFKDMKFCNDKDNSDSIKSKLKVLLDLENKLDSKELEDLNDFYKSEIYFHIGNCYFFTKDYSNSLKYYKTCLKYNGSFAACANILSIYINKYVDCSDTIQETQNIINLGFNILIRCDSLEISNDNSVCKFLNNVGVCYEHTENYIEAKKYYIIALQYNENYIDSLYNLARAYRKLSEKNVLLQNQLLSQSIDIYKKIVALDSHDIDSYLWMIDCAIKINNPEIFKTYLLAALANNPLNDKLIDYCLQLSIQEHLFLHPLWIDLFIDINKILSNLNSSNSKIKSNNNLQKLIENVNKIVKM